jgi:NADPH2:quinone reductase
MRSGNYLTKPDLPLILGYEAAGTIEELGENVSNLQIGQRVLATVSSGGYAEFATAKANLTMPIPDEIGFSESTALLVQGLTALGLLNETQSGQTILIHAAAGGVGSLLVQLAKHKGLRVLGTASSDEKLKFVSELGADFAINYSEDDWTDEVLKATDGKGVDWLIEMVGGAIVAKNLKVLAKHGTMWIYGAASGEDYKVSVLSLMEKNHGIRGYWLMNESNENRIKFTKELLGHLREIVCKFKLRNFRSNESKKRTKHSKAEKQPEKLF